MSSPLGPLQPSQVTFPTPPTVTRLIVGGGLATPIAVFTGTDSTGKVWAFNVPTTSVVTPAGGPT